MPRSSSATCRCCRAQFWCSRCSSCCSISLSPRPPLHRGPARVARRPGARQRHPPRDHRGFPARPRRPAARLRLRPALPTGPAGVRARRAAGHRSGRGAQCTVRAAGARGGGVAGRSAHAFPTAGNTPQMLLVYNTENTGPYGVGPDHEREGQHECAAAGFPFIGDIGGRGRDARGGANGACAGKQRCARRRIHPGFLGGMDPPVLARLRPAAVGCRSGGEQVAPAQRRRQQQSAGRRLHQSDLEAPCGGSREEARRDFLDGQ